MSETVKRDVHTPSHSFNKEDKDSGPVTYIAGKRSDVSSGVTYVKGQMPFPGGVGKHHKQSKAQGLTGKGHGRGHGGSGYPTKTSD